MDEHRDIQKTDQVSRFIDHYAVRTNPFGENRSGERAYRRAERITAALFLLTNHVPESEVIRAKVRAAGVDILSDVLGLRDAMRSSQSPALLDLQEHIRYAISLVRTLTISGYVSTQNATTMIEALDELGHFVLVSQRSILSENVSLSKDDLMDVRTPAARGARILKDTSDTPVVKDSEDVKDSQERVVKTTESKGSASVRVQSILEVLKAGGSMGIKDVAANLPEYSEKMIQRELLDLVSKGSVKKEGSKRWSRYSAAA